ncbi:Arc-like DNA binding domain-containing protein [Methylomagnum ishizawai]|uniref:Arc-like DNA binding domain-containing protein n=1 Tax=Methylomagnum ishizawai TaxID=1760988 RepID=A0A1Y6CTZ7_9GAMM|nr:Arc family DNA-binding protein [Methylomagnum ishizawai]SMF93901.1 Arc-like DNA binding domain-containing protein [Methylomagnum ishizawai]
MTTKPTQPYPIRMPQEMRSQFERAAKESGRSLHAEIMIRLERSLEYDREKAILSPLASNSIGNELLEKLAAVLSEIYGQANKMAEDTKKTS